MGNTPQITWDDTPKQDPKTPQVSWDAPKPKEASAQPSELTRGQGANQSLEAVNTAISRWRPRWDNPKAILQDPTWYGRSVKYAGGEAIGAAKAGAGVLSGGVKILNDLYSAIDPSEYYKRGSDPLKDLSGDISGVAKNTFYDLPKAAYDLLRHFPESSADPEQLGNTLAQIAMTVDGGIKGAKAITEHVFPTADAQLNESVAKVGAKTASQQASWAAYKASQAPVKEAIKWRAVTDTYIHNNGVGIANDLIKATTEAEKEDKIHTDNLAEIDKHIPAGTVKADATAKSINDSFAEIVKTPDPLNKTLNEVVKDANATAPGQWTFVKAMQFRTKIGRALSGVQGPQLAVLGRAYANLTTELGKIAKQYGLDASWNQHNELASKMHKSFPLIEKARSIVQENGEGAAMASALKNDPATLEVIKSLSKYGLNKEKVLSYAKEADKIIRERPGQNQRLTSYIYRIGPGTAPALAGLAAGKALASAAGAGSEGWIAGLGLGAGAGYATVMLKEYLRARRLAPEVLESIIKKREWPGKLAPPKGDFPTTTATAGEVAGPEPSKPSPPSAPSAPTPTQATMPEPPKTPEAKAIEERISPKAKARQAAKEAKPVKTATPKETPKPQEAPKTEPQVTKVAEGEHGTGKVAKQAKARERVAKVRAEKGSTALGGGTLQVSGGGAAEEELKKAEARTIASPVDVSKMDVVDLERELQHLNKSRFAEAIEMRKKFKLSSEDYRGALEYYLLEEKENLQNNFE